MTKNAKANPAQSAAPEPAISKIEVLLARLRRDDGATIEELAAATGWLKHSVRGAMAGSLKKKGHTVVSIKTDGVRRYRLEGAS